MVKPRRSDSRASVSNCAKMGVGGRQCQKTYPLLSSLSPLQPQRTPVNPKFSKTSLENQYQRPHSSPVNAWFPNSKTPKRW